MTVKMELRARTRLSNAENSALETIYASDININDNPDIKAVKSLLVSPMCERLGIPLTQKKNGGEMVPPSEVSFFLGVDMKSGCYTLYISEKNAEKIRFLYSALELDV